MEDIWEKNVVKGFGRFNGVVYVVEMWDRNGRLFEGFMTMMLCVSLCFHAKFTWERGKFAFFDSNMLMLWLICVFRENLWVLRTKIAFTRSWRKSRGQTEPLGANGAGWKKACRAQGSCTTVLQGSRTRKSTRGHRAMQHAVPWRCSGSTVCPCWRARPCHYARVAVFRNLNSVPTIFSREFLWLGFVMRLN